MDAGESLDPLRSFLTSGGGDHWTIDTRHILHGTTAYLVQSFDHDALQFSFPLLVHRDIWSEIALDPSGSDGAAAEIIERIKARAEALPELGPLYGRGTRFPLRYSDTIEAYSIIHSDDALASHLWKADDRNYCDHAGIHLIVRGALPIPGARQGQNNGNIGRVLADLAGAIARIIEGMPLPPLEEAWTASLDQKGLRRLLPDHGLVSFVGDGSRLARAISRHRSYFRVAGPKERVHIPFACPADLGPVELELPASCRVATGLGIRQREVFAIAGSNAQGKTTFLEGVLAGMDDHAPGDGRERVVTVRGVRVAESTAMGLAGADISMFFHALPPGVSGTVRSAHGRGSGSMSMAWQVQDAITRQAPLLIIDEDKSAPNLLVKSCLQKEEVTPLSEILGRERERMGDTTLVFAACAMDALIAQADRIMVLDRHAASATAPAAFRAILAESLRKTADDLEKRGNS